jgi:hypothetical protein
VKTNPPTISITILLPTYVDPGIPASVDTVLQKCLSKNREDRYQESRMLLADLGTLAGNRGRQNL